MYNEQIENLINAALTDGVLTEKEKQILFKKAESMGIDLDEFEMVLSSKLYEKQKAMEEERKKKSDAAPKSNKMGDVRKCPACGAIVSSYQVKCPECGYEFSGVQSNSSAQLLADKLVEASRGNTSMKDEFATVFFGAAADKVTKVQVQIIETFPIPTTKADLLEFMALLEARSHTTSMTTDIKEKALCNAYSKKLRECLNKVKANYKDDPDFASYVKSAKKTIIGNKLGRYKPFIVLIVLCLLCCWFVKCAFDLSEGSNNSEENVACTEEVISALERNDPNAAEQSIRRFNGYPSKACNLLMNYYIEKNDTSDVVRFARNCNENDYSINGLTYNYLIHTGLYDEAKIYVGRFVNETTRLDLINYIEDVVNDMCKKGQKDDAIKFVKREASQLDYSSDETIDKMTKLIESY